MADKLEICRLLDNLTGPHQVTELFCRYLNYRYVDEPLPIPDHFSDLLHDNPLLLATAGVDEAFHVIYLHLRSAVLRRSDERRLISQLANAHPFALYVTSNLDQTRWRFVNVQVSPGQPLRRVLRRMAFGPGESVRTAAERISGFLDLTEAGADDGAAIWQRHDQAFDVEAVTESFYKDYAALLKEVCSSLSGVLAEETAHEFSLQLLNRCMFICFIQRKAWLGGDLDFLHNLWRSYRQCSRPTNTFYRNWLSVVFFQAFSNQKRPEEYSHMPDYVKQAISGAPYLNGGLFARNKLDRQDLSITDETFDKIIGFLSQYNFTIEEDGPLDQEVAVDPEMLGKVYERQVNTWAQERTNADNGTVYTPRTEIDLMCRLALVDNLANHLGDELKAALYTFVMALEDEEKVHADDHLRELGLSGEIVDHLRSLTIVDPACGSGSFLLGMLNILDDLQARLDDTVPAETSFERKKRIIGTNLFGVDVMRWAVDIAQLRLWLALVVDSGLTLQEATQNDRPILPHLSFRLRVGDSIVQECDGRLVGHLRMSKEQASSTASLRRQLALEKAMYYEATDPGVDLVRIYEMERRLFGTAFKHELAPLLSSSREMQFVWAAAFPEVFGRGGFDIVIGNPPYVRHERFVVSEFYKGTSLQTYKTSLRKTVELALPQFFVQLSTVGSSRNTVDGKSDLYVYFCFLGMSILSEQGTFCFITANAWLDTGYGKVLQKYFAETEQLYMIINFRERSFDASVNTIIAVASRRRQSQAFFISGLQRKNIGSDIPKECLLLSAHSATEKQVTCARVNPADTVKDIRSCNDGLKQRLGKWGAWFLRAPGVYWEIMRSAQDLRKLRCLVDLQYGTKTGAKGFFHLSAGDVATWGIEPQFLTPLLDSSQNLNSYKLEQNAYLFTCNSGPRDLHGTAALRYIKHGEARGYHRRASTKTHRPFWYTVPTVSTSFLFFRFWYERFWTPWSVSSNLVCSDNFMIAALKDLSLRPMIAIILNSAWYFLQLELFGRVNQGEGVLTTYGMDYDWIRVPEPCKISRLRAQELFDELGTARPLVLTDQLRTCLQREIDRVVFDALGLSELERSGVYEGLLQMVNERTRKAAREKQSDAKGVAYR